MSIVFHDVRLTDEVYWALVEKKFRGRHRSIDEVLRPLLGLPCIHRRVQNYSDRAVMEESVSPEPSTEGMTAKVCQGPQEPGTPQQKGAIEGVR